MPVSRRDVLKAGTLLALPAGWSLVGRESCAAKLVEYTEKSRESIRRGYKWLLKTFNRDGGCGIDVGTGISDISCTAVVGLALMSEGNTLIEGLYSRQLRSITAYLLDAVVNDRFTVDLRSEVRADLSAYADHHFAALFLSQAMGQGRAVSPLKAALTRLIDVIARSQHKAGHWGAGRYPRLAAVTGWCSLRGAQFAGMNVQGSAENTAKFLIADMKKNLDGDDLFGKASGLRVLYAMSLNNEPIAKKAFEIMLKSARKDFPSFNQFGGEQYLAFHLLNETMLQRGGKTWRTWFPPVRDKLIAAQNKDGSWTGHSCITSRTFCTAAALLVLTSPNRYLPISQA